MLHAATLFTGFCLIFGLATHAWASPQGIVLTAGAAAFSTAFAVRAGGAGAAFTHALRVVMAWFAGLPMAIGGALATIRAALAADVALQPALVRVRAPSLGDRDAFLTSVGSTPGAVVVSAEGESVLLHVLDEGRIDAERLSALQKRAVRR
jgi:hypothetical protein